jgi:glycosyltransferase involved in cell wall biosynthesis
MPGSICVVGHLMLPLLGGTGEPVVGGAEVQSFHLAEELHRRGWRLSFLVCSLDEHGSGVRSTPLGPAEVLYARRLAKTPAIKLREKYATFAAVRRTDADLVFQRAVWDADVAALAARLAGRPFVYALASDRDAVGLPRWSRRRNVLRLATAIAAQSETQRDWVRRYGRAATVVPSGFPVPAWRPPAARRDVLWVGTLRTLKRPEIFLDLAAALPERPFVLCGGPGEDATIAAAVARRAAALPNVHHAGFVPYRAIQARFASARVLVNTSTYEGFPNTFVLAWLHGAVVLSLGVDPDGVLERERLGLVARDERDLREGLCRLLSDDSLCAELAARARARAEQHHDIRDVATAYEAVFAAALGR